ncbi:MAG: LTA synthase family protein [Anaeroplasma sp.]
MRRHAFIWITILYFVLNILNTYFLSSELLNKYIISFDHTFLGELFSFLGNFAVLGILYLFGYFILRKPKKITVYLLVITLILNVCIVAIQYYNKGYKLAFSFFNFTLLKSPTGGFGSNVFLDWLRELFLNYRIICLIPFLLILAIFISSRKLMSNEKIFINPSKLGICLMILLIFQLSSFTYYRVSLNNNWGYSTEYAQYGIQNAGAYNYYVNEILLHVDNRNIKDDKTIEERFKDLEEYNTNKESYINIIDGKEYSNVDNQTGILKGKNLFVIQMESTMSFCLQNTYNNVEITPYLNKLIDDQNTFYFKNAYTSVGIGNTSDAEFSFFTGFYPTGDMTIAWEYDIYDFDLYSIPQLFNNYNSYSYNGTDESFYNHNNLHEGLYKVKDFKGLDTFESIYSKEEYPEKFFNYWISDATILNWAKDIAITDINNGINTISFVETITPHNPFPDYSDELAGYVSYDYDLSITNKNFANYLNMIKYNDKLIYNFIMDVTNPNSQNYMKDTVFLIYGDHGNNFSKEAYEDLLKKDLTDLEYRKLILNIPIIFIDPSGSIYNSLINTNIDFIESQVKSNTNMYRTILNLWGIETDSHYYGVNMFSGEPTFTYDPKNFDIITDDFMYSKKKNEFILFNNNGLNEDVLNHIFDYRMKQDDYLNTLVYMSDKQ